MDRLYRIFESHCAEYNIEIDGSAKTAVMSKLQNMVDETDGYVDLGYLDDLFRHVLSNRAKRAGISREDASALQIIGADVL